MRLVDFKIHDGRTLSVDAEQIVALVGQGDSTVIVAGSMFQAVVGSLEEVKTALAPKFEVMTSGYAKTDHAPSNKVTKVTVYENPKETK